MFVLSVSLLSPLFLFICFGNPYNIDINSMPGPSDKVMSIICY